MMAWGFVPGKDMGTPNRDSESNRALGTLICPGCGAVSHLEAKFCSQCGAGIAPFHHAKQAFSDAGIGYETRVAGEVERRQLTVVFCDLVGSTSLATEVDPEDLKDIINAFFKAVADAVAEFDGYVARYAGDGVLVLFGYPEAHEDDAERAVHAALKALDDVAALDVPGQRRLAARVGIATGLVVVGRLQGAAAPGTLDVAGETPNLAARLQGNAEPNAIVADAATRRLVGELFEWRDLGLLPLKGLREPVQEWRVVGKRPVSSRFDAQRDSSLTPMLGRDPDRATLLELWRRARAGSGQIALITGEAGVGKSRLAASILKDTQEDARATLRYFCSPYRQGSPLHPCIQQLEHAAGFLRDDTPETKLSKLEATLGGAPQQDVALIAELLDLPATKGFPVLRLSPQAKRQRTMQALISGLERLTRQAPTLMVFEDAQWSDETSRELLGVLVSRVARLPVLLLVLARPEFHPDWVTQAHVSCITLEPLSPEMSAALVHFVAKHRTLPPQLVADIVARTDGMPLFLEEVTQAIVESQEGRAGARANGSHEPALPLSLQASLLSRLDRLGGAREIAEVAAAIGRDFTSDLLALVVDNADDLQALLDRLVGSGLVQRRPALQRGYTFKHALIRDAAYGIMTREKRRALQARIAQTLEKHFPETAANHPEVMAWHCTEAREIEKAVTYWLRAGQQALRRSAMAEALKHLRRGVELITATEDSSWRLRSELDLTIAIGKAQIATQGYAIASTRDTFAKAQVLCERLGEPPQLLAVLHGLWTHALMRGEFRSAQAQANALLVRGKARDDRTWLLMGCRFSGVTHFPMGEFSQASRLLERGLGLYDPAQQAAYATLTVDDPRVVMLTYLSWSMMCLGQFADARSYSEQAVAEARRMGHVYTLAHALNGAAFVALTIDSPQTALKKLDELAAVLADNGIAYYEAVETIFRGWCLAACGEFDRAKSLLAVGMSSYRATGSLLYLSGFLRMSAEAHAWAGTGDVALELIEESLSIMEATDQRWDEAEVRRVRGSVLRARGDTGAAEAAYRGACAVARAQGAKLWELRAALASAELHSAQGSPALARAVLEPISRSFEPALETPDILRARALLEAVTSVACE
jgi:class 3 adenylate cyclase/predicted ATPase